MDEIARIEEQFCAEKLTREEAIEAMKHLGLDASEANDLLNSAIS